MSGYKKDRAEYMSTQKSGELRALKPFDSDTLAAINSTVKEIAIIEEAKSASAYPKLSLTKNNDYYNNYAGIIPEVEDELIELLNEYFIEMYKNAYNERIEELKQHLKDEYNFTYTHSVVFCDEDGDLGETTATDARGLYHADFMKTLQTAQLYEPTHFSKTALENFIRNHTTTYSSTSATKEDEEEDKSDDYYVPF